MTGPSPRGLLVINTSIVVGVFATVAVILRLLARWRSKACFGIDDLLIVASLVPQFAMIVLGHLLVYQAGMGTPMRDLQPAQVSLFLKYLMIGTITYSLTITLVKIGLLVLYRRIFNTPQFRMKALIVGALCISWFIVVVPLEIFQCRPFSAFFNAKLLATGRCMKLKPFYWGVVATNLGIDLILLYLPIHEVWKLQLPKRQKVTLSGVLLLGSLVCVAGIMRLVALDAANDDLTFSLLADYLWSQIEPGAAIVCACIVTLKPLFTNIKLPFSSVSSIFSRSNVPSSRRGISMSLDSHDRPWPPWSPGLEPSDARRLRRPNEKAAKGALYIININCSESSDLELREINMKDGKK